ARAGAGRHRPASASATRDPERTYSPRRALAATPPAGTLRDGAHRATIPGRRAGEPPGGTHLGTALGTSAAATAWPGRRVWPLSACTAVRVDGPGPRPHRQVVARHPGVVELAVHRHRRAQAHRSLFGQGHHRTRATVS